MDDGFRHLITDDEDEEDAARAWETLTTCFKEVQSVLDLNHTLIQQVNHNHSSKVPTNLADNVKLISQINSNISKAITLYSNLSAEFSVLVHQRHRSMGGAKSANDSDSSK